MHSGHDDIIRRAVEELQRLIREFEQYRATALPLCAAENVISPLASLPIASGLSDRYIMGGLFGFDETDNFIGSAQLHPFYKLINDLAQNLFHATYADPRPLSGTNAITSVLLALTAAGDSVLLSSPDTGGHPSVVEVCKRLGLQITDIPYNYATFNYDVDALNDLLAVRRPTFLILAPSDILQPPPIDDLRVPPETTIIYDATQSLGLIAGGAWPSPLLQTDKIVISGGTHKTLPGPTKGLILARNSHLISAIDESISPRFVRNTQMGNVASLAIVLLEMLRFGAAYIDRIIANANYLGGRLQKKGFDVARLPDGTFTRSHQVFVHMPADVTDALYLRAISNGVTLNKKRKRLFSGTGIRLGVQEITRYGWGEPELDIIADILSAMASNASNGTIANRLGQLPERRIVQYTFTPSSVEAQGITASVRGSVVPAGRPP